MAIDDAMRVELPQGFLAREPSWHGQNSANADATPTAASRSTVGHVHPLQPRPKFQLARSMSIW
jgi:hypothetical protein